MVKGCSAAVPSCSWLVAHVRWPSERCCLAPKPSAPPASAAPSGSAAPFGSGVRDRGGGAETASSDVAQAIAPKLFSPGACMVFPPTADDRNATGLLGPAKAGYFDTPSQMPGALIEPLFVTDPFEASIAASVHGQQVIAKALAEAIEQYVTGS